VSVEEKELVTPKTPMDKLECEFREYIENIRQKEDTCIYCRWKEKTIADIIDEVNTDRLNGTRPNYYDLREFLREKGYYWILPPIKRYTNEYIVFNYFYSYDREHYRKAGNISFDDYELIDYGWWPLAVRAKNCFVINADIYSPTTSAHTRLAISISPKNTPQIPFSALRAAEIEPTEIYLIDKSSDIWEEKIINGKVVVVHHLGSSLFEYDGRYFLSTLDTTSRRMPYALMELPEKAETIDEAFFIVSGLTKEEYDRYLTGEIKRQGEFFFIPIGDTKTLKQKFPWIKKLDIQKHVDLARVFDPKHAGNAHVATEAIITELGGVFVRKTVRHKRIIRTFHGIEYTTGEHNMVRLGNVWHLVKKNRAINSWTAGGRVD